MPNSKVLTSFIIRNPKINLAKLSEQWRSWRYPKIFWHCEIFSKYNFNYRRI